MDVKAAVRWAEPQAYIPVKQITIASSNTTFKCRTLSYIIFILNYYSIMFGIG